MIPQASTRAVTDVAAATTVTQTTTSNPATWINIRNRSSSANNIDLSWDGTNYGTRLAPGESFSVGGRSGPPLTISSVTLVCPDAAGTATAEITTTYGS